MIASLGRSQDPIRLLGILMVNLLSGDHERRRDCSMSKNDMHITELAHDSLIVP
jgi:hypothetical protein